jgi:hypothetical protein
MPSSVAGISAVDGPEHGNLAVSGGTLTIDSGAKLVINNGYGISFSGGSVALASGATIVFGQDMCGTDNDGDGYVSGSNWTAVSSCGGMASRVNVSGTFGDCNDYNINVHPGQATYFATPTTTDLGANTYDYNCDGVISYAFYPSTQVITGCAWNGVTTYACTATYGSVGNVACGGNVYQPYCQAMGPTTCSKNSGSPYPQGCV